MGVGRNSELTALLTATDSTWSAAVATSQSAASLELASGTAVIRWAAGAARTARSRWPSSRPTSPPVRSRYYIGGGKGGGPAAGAATGQHERQIAEWVAATYPATTVGGQTVYDLQS